MWCNFGDIPLEISSQRNPRSPPCATLDLTRSNCQIKFRAWSTSQVLHVLEFPLLTCTAPEIQEIAFSNRSASDLGLGTWNWKTTIPIFPAACNSPHASLKLQKSTGVKSQLVSKANWCQLESKANLRTLHSIPIWPAPQTGKPKKTQTGPLSLLSRQICTTHPACQLVNSL